MLHVSSLFPKAAPPVLSFSMGTLGFLMPFGRQSMQPSDFNEIHLTKFARHSELPICAEGGHRQQKGSFSSAAYEIILLFASSKWTTACT